MMAGHIDIDDRTWNTAYRGPVAIHASKTFEPNFYYYLKHILHLDVPDPHELRHGGIVAIGQLVDVLKPGQVTEVPPQRRAHGGGHCHGLVFKDIYPVEFIPYKGSQMLFNVELAAEQIKPLISPPDQTSLF